MYYNVQFMHRLRRALLCMQLFLDIVTTVILRVGMPSVADYYIFSRNRYAIYQV